jgi:carboxypeptidase family protein
VRVLFLIAIATSPALACSCVSNLTACSAISDNTAVFLGRVLVDSGEGWGDGPAHLAVEEVYANLSKEIEDVEVNTGSGSSCYHRLREGNRYVVFATRGKDGSLGIGGCSRTFDVQGKENVLDALRDKTAGGPARLVGKVYRNSGDYSRDDVVAGAVVVAEADGVREEVLTDGHGNYTFLGLPPGGYRVSVHSASYLPDERFNSRWTGSGWLVVEDNRFEKARSYGPIIHDRGCDVWDLAMWRNGRISGTVRDYRQRPLEGIVVEAFGVERDEFNSRPLKSATTGPHGGYRIEGLPSGFYIVGVNTRKYQDSSDFPPTFFRDGGMRSQAARLYIEDAGELAGVNLVLPPKRKKAIVVVEVHDPDGSTAGGVGLKLLNQAGVQRWSSTEATDDKGRAEIPLYFGEAYRLEAFDYQDGAAFRGSVQLEVTGEDLTAFIQLHEEEI